MTPPAVIEHKPVASSNVASVGYDQPSQCLEVKFINGSVYRYFAVAALTAVALAQAESVGKYLAEHIKGHYEFVRVR